MLGVHVQSRAVHQADIELAASVEHRNAIIVQELAGVFKLEVGNGLHQSLHRLLWS